MSSLQIAKLGCTAAANKKAKRMVVMDLRGLSDICDIQIVCSGDSDRQTRAIAQGIEETLKSEMGLSPVSVEGRQSGQWILLDYGSAIIHVFFDSIRGFYALEELWPSAKFMDMKDLDA